MSCSRPYPLPYTAQQVNYLYPEYYPREYYDPGFAYSGYGYPGYDEYYYPEYAYPEYYPYGVPRYPYPAYGRAWEGRTIPRFNPYGPYVQGLFNPPYKITRPSNPIQAPAGSNAYGYALLASQR